MNTNENSSRPPQDLIVARLTKLRKVLDEHNIEALLVTGSENKGWMSGFTTGVFIAPGGAVIISQDEAIFITSHVDYDECVQDIPHMTIVAFDHFTEVLHDRVAAVAAQKYIKSLSIESSHITVADADTYEQCLSKHDIDLQRVSPLITPLREIKDPWEIEQIKNANRVNARAFSETLDFLKPGATEWDIAAELEYRLRKYSVGSARLSFQSIVASGPNSALPHASVSQRELQQGDFVKFDFGATWNGYCSDCTRTVVIGKASDKQRAVYNAVLKAQVAAIERIREGESCAVVNDVAMNVLSAEGFGDYIAHGLGHGVGLYIHEGPRQSVQSKDVYAPGNIVTVEPGLYIAGWGGVRIEDNILISEDGIENLTLTPKDLLEL